uniref:Ependymin-like 1 n=1 Tax=Monopterus albus TaxID=43700 RepID=A0A3Q3INM3_MONAL
MRCLAGLLFLLSGCLASKPQPCLNSLTFFLQTTQNEKLLTTAQYLYDALGERIRIFEQGTYENKTFIRDVLLLYREGAMYDIFDNNRTCKKTPLKAAFQPLEVPKTASLLGQVILGSSSKPGGGLLVNSWWGELSEKAGKFLTTVTEFGCIPINSLYQTEDFGWTVINFFDNIIGISDPNLLNPPDFCSNADTEKEPVDFLSLFHKKN